MRPTQRRFSHHRPLLPLLRPRTMEGVKFAAVLLLFVLVQTVSALAAPLSAEDEEGQMWTVDNWQGFPVERGLTIRLADLIKRSKAQQFHGLMGRSPGSLARLGRKRNNNNKGEMFVGLMGRRSSEDSDEEWKPDSF